MGDQGNQSISMQDIQCRQAPLTPSMMAEAPRIPAITNTMSCTRQRMGKARQGNEVGVPMQPGTAGTHRRTSKLLHHIEHSILYQQRQGNMMGAKLNKKYLAEGSDDKAQHQQHVSIGPEDHSCHRCRSVLFSCSASREQFTHHTERS